MYLKPAPGLRIVDPVLRDFLPESGREVAPDPYWHRRLRDGDVIAAQAAAPSTADSKPSRKSADQ